MMAKMFYTLDEARAALGKTEEEIKQYAREGRLREFRDGPRLMFKADQVENLKAELTGSGGPIDIGVSDSGAPIGLVDSKGASGTSITLSDSDVGGSGMQKEDTALAADLGLSGSVGGMPSPGRPGGTGTGMSMTGTRSGINVFGTEEGLEHADPSAQTAISSSVTDQVNLESVGSGSGLLDLTRESDYTSLGAELLDEIAPGTAGATRRGPVDSATGTGTGIAIPSDTVRPGGRIAGAPVYVEAADPMAPAFGAAALAAVVMLAFGAFALMSAMFNTEPDIVAKMAKLGFWIVSAIGLGVALIFFVVGLIIGRAGSR